MTVKRRKKITKKRGTRSCGWGLDHRGSGSQGGAGNAGRGKKANSKAPQSGLWTKQLMGKHGFIHKGPVSDDKVINLRDLEDRLPVLLSQKLATESAGIVNVDISKLGCTKVLSTGKVRRKWKINAERASPDAIEKVKSAGGELLVGKPEAKASAQPAKTARAE
jgi:large subunit ribosomal protein L15